ncbi:SusC/RagA family TonB-linked outer membrane protein [Chryseolinea lacunae]|uniref:TonB-dependent receptor n=1 Tax=Chryseolinea lacunae TaxID=2801331 RepID=A0ABS1KSH9_9BACT|nr:TonB-dependent receptor [Chryseolinea lacunae]MBL0741246.1 TonB-dependent receptor [Chryseolinea lacunae]
MKPFTLQKWLWLLFLGMVSLAHAQERTISGKVTDADTGDLLPGVNVVIKGSSTGTSTDADGKYSLSVPGNDAVLVFSFIGFQTLEVPVGNQTTINPTLGPDTKALEEVVVVGYGTQRKVDLTGAVGSLRASDIDIGSKPITSPDQLLGGRVAGVQITNRSGDPGAPIDVRIRGVGTAGVNSPLWVIDGVPIVQTSNITVNTSSTTESNPLAGINPSDIESIDVLKDASAAAIYGSRAANGVIIVTTKRGKDGKAQLTYDGYVGAGTPWKKLDVLNTAEYINIQQQLGRDFSQFAGQPTVDWQDQVFRTSKVVSHNVGISGGNPNANYFVGVGYMDQQGLELGQGFKRYSIKANSDIKVGDRIKIGESILLSSVDRSIQSEDAIYAAFNSALNQPFFKVYDPAGPSGYNAETVANRGSAGGSNNYVMRTDPNYSYTTVLSRKAMASVYGELEIIKGLKYRISGGIDYNVGDGNFYQGPMGFNGLPKSSLLVQERPIEMTTNFNQTLTYIKTFGKHNITLLAGHEETNFRYDKVRLQGSNLFSPDIKFASTGTQVAGANEADQWALRGYLGRINYAFNDKYLFTFNVRKDYSSRFSKNNRSQAFPSFSAGWRISQESFFPKGNVVDDVKLRAGWGQTGNQFSTTTFPYLQTLATTIFYVVGTGAQVPVRGVAPITLANQNVKWETGEQFDIGADIALLSGKVDITFDYYNKTSKGILLGLPPANTSGFFLPIDANVGKMVNRGIELSANYNGQAGQVKYSVGGNVTTVHNEVLDLGSIPEIITGVGGASTHRTKVGEAIGSFYGYKTDGIFQNQAEIDAAVPDVNSADRQPGDIRFVDVNGDGRVDSEDRTNLGSYIPKFFYGINASARFMNFDFTLLLQGVSGQKVYNQARAAAEDEKSATNFYRSVLGHWSGEGTSNSMPRLTQSDDNQNTRYSDRWIESGSFMRIRNIQLGYAIPATQLKNWTGGMITRFRIYVAAQNLYTFTNYSGFDPEVTRGQSFQKGETPLATGQDGGSSPQPRIIQFGWQVTF